ncbi:MAG: cardiolipin synthase [Ruminococcus sp.]|nr:cardiolipin synthase [Ruminococcus sp.]
MDDKDIIRLIPKRKKSFWRLIFSRAFLILALLIVQIGVLVSIYFLFTEYLPQAKVLLVLFSVLMVFYLFNCEMDSAAKLTWLVLITLFPVPGSILLFFTKQDIGHIRVKKRVINAIAQSKDMLPLHSEVLADEELASSGTDSLCRYINRTGCFPIYRNSDAAYFPIGEKKFEALLAELEKAERFIFLEYFIIDEGYMWGKVLNILARKASQGVDVRVMYDGMCEMSTLTYDYSERLAKLGIKAKAFAPILPFLSTYYNYRDHRKILVIDGKVGFTGGVNLADEYINKREKFGHWKDCAVMLRGEAVRSFTLMFLQMWNVGETEPQWDEWLSAPYGEDSTNCGFVLPYGDCPLDEEKVGETVYMDILNRATRYVHIMTPYLILDGEMEYAIRFAAERGIDVKIILPGIPDKKGAYALAKTHYAGLTKSGVKIYEYAPGFVHSKMFVCDGEKAVVGTINLDYRSLYHHFECAAYMYKTPCIPDIEADFQDTLTKCREVTPETIKHEKLFYKVAGELLKLVAPLF